MTRMLDSVKLLKIDFRGWGGWGGILVGWLTLSHSGGAGTSLTINVQQNNSGARRSATVTVSSGSLTRTLLVSQTPAMAAVRGPRVIECFGRNGYVDLRGSATSTNIECVSRSSAERPIWNFVHQYDNVFTIRNETTGRYFTESNGDLRHEASISGANSDRQHWLLIPQPGGSFRIHSVSNDTLYVQEGAHIPLTSPNITLASRNTSHNRQL